MTAHNNTCQSCARVVEPGQQAIVIQYGKMAVSGYVTPTTQRDVFHYECDVAISQGEPEPDPNQQTLLDDRD